MSLQLPGDVVIRSETPWAPPAAAQVIQLSSFDAADASLRGRVRYPPAFEHLA